MATAMDKKAYLDRLDELLDCLPKDKRAEARSFYEEAIDDRMEDGMSEEEAVAAMGSAEIAAEVILGELPAVPRAVAKTRRKSRVLLWVLAIAGSVVWVPLGLAFVVAAVAVYLSIWIAAACIWIAAASFVLALPLGLYLAWCGIMEGLFAFAFAQAGMGFVFGGLGLIVFNLAFSASRALALLSQKWARKALSPFKRIEDDPAPTRAAA